ncbi:MAG: hypothetical protein Kow0069_33740 [Promethearchaeota archaeon]
MNRQLLEEMLNLMAKTLKEGGDVGDLKIGALFALGSQLEAIFYFCGHELASKLEVGRASSNEMKSVVNALKDAATRYHLGELVPLRVESSSVTFELRDCSSCRKLVGVSTETTYCAFEAGLFAGLVEKITGGDHAFAQEIVCKCQGHPACQFMVVLQDS